LPIRAAPVRAEIVKAWSIFCSAILKALGNYDFKYRFVSENLEDDYYHVYLVVMHDSGEDI